MVEKRRALQAKKQRLLKGLETLMRMAPDVVATRPGGGVADDWTESSHGLLQQGSRRYLRHVNLGVKQWGSVVVLFGWRAAAVGGGSRGGVFGGGLCRVRNRVTPESTNALG